MPRSLTFADRLLNAIARSGYNLDEPSLLDEEALTRATAEGPLTSVRQLRGFGSLEPWNPLAYAARHALSQEGQWGALDDLLGQATPPLRMDEPAGVPAGTTTLGFIGLALWAEWRPLGGLTRQRLPARARVLKAHPAEILWPLALDTADTLMRDPGLPKGLGLRLVGACWDSLKRFAVPTVECPENVRDPLVRRLAQAPWLFHGMHPYQREDAREWMGKHPAVFAAFLEAEQPVAAPASRARPRM